MVSATAAERARGISEIAVATGLILSLFVLPGGKRTVYTTVGYGVIIVAAAVAAALTPYAKYPVLGVGLGCFVTDTIPAVQVIFAVIIAFFTVHNMDAIVLLTVLTAFLMIGVLASIFYFKPRTGILPEASKRPTNDGVIPLLM